MIDLTVNKNRFYEIKMPDGEVLKIKRPTQKMLLKMAAMQHSITDTNLEDSLESIFNLTVEILNWNTIGNTYTFDDLSDYISFQTAVLIIKEYLEFATAEIKK